MPRNKDLKRVVRARMLKTGESYTAALTQVRRKAAPTPGKAAPPRIAIENVDYAALAGMSDKVLKERTGCTWERWVPLLDRLGAAGMRHGELARMIHEKFKVDGWWAQAVTVGYERITGKRAIGQRMDGSYEASKSRTFNVPVAKVFAAFEKPSQRKKWLDGEKVVLRTATANKSVRLGWSDRTIVAVWFTPKGTGKTAVSLAHSKLPDRATSTRLKQFWGERLDALGAVLEK